ncbi:MAG: methylmalonyl-CoA epimerase [Euryarchaeota archaeon]|nr:methylmalonyl-CoA epimerase [Euryarchaeota archaeon]
MGITEWSIMSKPRIDHVGIATNSIEEAAVFWEALGLVSKQDDVNQEQGVRIRMMEGDTNSPNVELLEPLGSDTPVGKFISKRGEGIQQLAFTVIDIEDTISRLIELGCKMINEEPTKGIEGSLIAFVHPSSTGGVLVELVQHN